MGECLCFYGDALDFHQCVFGKTCHLKGGPGRVGGSEEFGVDPVHSGKILHVCQVHGGLDHIAQASTGSIQNAFQMIIRIALRAPLMIVFSIIMTVSVSPRMSLIFICMVPVLTVIFIFAHK